MRRLHSPCFAVLFLFYSFFPTISAFFSTLHRQTTGWPHLPAFYRLAMSTKPLPNQDDKFSLRNLEQLSTALQRLPEQVTETVEEIQLLPGQLVSETQERIDEVQRQIEAFRLGVKNSVEAVIYFPSNVTAYVLSVRDNTRQSVKRTVCAVTSNYRKIRGVVQTVTCGIKALIEKIHDLRDAQTSTETNRQRATLMATVRAEDVEPDAQSEDNHSGDARAEKRRKAARVVVHYKPHSSPVESVKGGLFAVTDTTSKALALLSSLPNKAQDSIESLANTIENLVALPQRIEQKKEDVVTSATQALDEVRKTQDKVIGFAKSLWHIISLQAAREFYQQIEPDVKFIASKPLSWQALVRVLRILSGRKAAGEAAGKAVGGKVVKATVSSEAKDTGLAKVAQAVDGVKNEMQGLYKLWQENRKNQGLDAVADKGKIKAPKNSMSTSLQPAVFLRKMISSKVEDAPKRSQENQTLKSGLETVVNIAAPSEQRSPNEVYSVPATAMFNDMLSATNTTSKPMEMSADELPTESLADLQLGGP